MQQYLENVFKDDIRSIISAPYVSRLPFKAILIDLSHLKDNQPVLFEKFMKNVWDERGKWIKQLNEIQQQKLAEMEEYLSRECSVKDDFPVNFFNMPIAKKTKEFNCDIKQLWKPVQVKGKVIRTGTRYKEELYREYKCRKCSVSVIIEASRCVRFHFREPKKCGTQYCKGNMYTDENAENLDFYIEFQAIKIQTEKIDSLPVELESELAESCFVGDEVIIFGTFETRSRYGEIGSHEYMLRAMSVIVPENQKKMSKDMAELTFVVRDDWSNELDALGGVGSELQMRDEMVKSVAPELKGLAVIKLSLLLLLVSGGKSTATSKGTTSKTVREIMHLLMIGDPGLGKSQLLKAASKIAANSVRCIGYSTTTAGLTAQFFRENNETFIEAGALVKANNGVCCIDEINFMSKEHRGSIHEVMEQQKITMAKAGMIAEIPSKVSIIAGMNKKNAALPVEAGNINIEGSLLSRFDVIFNLEDPRDNAADAEVSWHILNESSCPEPSWSLERLKDHVMVAKEVDAKMTTQAEQILQRYYLFCQNQPAIDQSRNTIRMWNAINRMALCHAKLMLRTKVQLIDALAVVMLMENCWSMGHLGLKQPDAMRATYPLGPSKQIALEILEKLDLEHLLDDLVIEDAPRTKNSQPSQSKHEVTLENVSSIFEDDEDEPSFPASQSQSSRHEAETEVISQTASIHLSPVEETAEVDYNEELNSDQFPSSSTQKSEVIPPSQIRKSSFTFFSQAKRPRLVQAVQQESKPPAQDLVYTSLNALAGNLMKQSSPALTAVRSVEKTSTKSFSDKLKKFEYLENTEDATPVEQKENAETAESSKPEETDDDDMDVLTNFSLW